MMEIITIKAVHIEMVQCDKNDFRALFVFLCDMECHDSIIRRGKDAMRTSFIFQFVREKNLLTILLHRNV